MVPADDLTTRIFDIGKIRLHAIFFPLNSQPKMAPFWVDPGVGISSRTAEDCLANIDTLHEVSVDDPAPQFEEAPSQGQLRERIAGLLERTAPKPRQKKVSHDDVYLYQTGMAAIYYLHHYLQQSRNATTVQLGFPFHSTVHVFALFAPGFKHLGPGNKEDIDELEELCKSEASQGRQLQAVWTEVPYNPMLNTADMYRLRHLADTYNFILVVDDTVGSFCNVDVLPVADVVLTSLTKSFSGYADVMGGSIALNPTSPRYSYLKSLFQSSFHNDLYNRDADVLEHNSRDYLARSLTLNKNAEAIVAYLDARARDPKSAVKHIYYPTEDPSLPNYTALMRPPTPEFPHPGYGCLFSVELATLETTIAFYENLHVHITPHLGAHRTVALAYIKGLFAKELDKVARWGLNERTIRVSVGLEDVEELREIFEHAVAKADEAFGREKGEEMEDTGMGVVMT